MKYIGIWYDFESEKERDVCEANNEAEARQIFFNRKPDNSSKGLFLTIINESNNSVTPDYSI